MIPNIEPSWAGIERALRNLQKERTACVARLTALLEKAGSARDVELCLARIDTINATLIRLASSQMAH